MSIGESAFVFSILEEATRADLLSIERRYVVSGQFAFNALVPRRNSMQGRRHSPEALALMRENRKGIPGPTAKGGTFSQAHMEAIWAAAAKRRAETIARKLAEKKPRKVRDLSTYARGPEHRSFGPPFTNKGCFVPEGFGPPMRRSP